MPDPCRLVQYRVIYQSSTGIVENYRPPSMPCDANKQPHATRLFPFSDMSRTRTCANAVGSSLELRCELSHTTM